MTPTAPPAAPRRRALLRAAVLLLLIGGAGAAALAWYRSRPPKPPRPPEVELDGADPLVAAAVRATREAILKDPRNADLWGRLGKVLLVSGHGHQALFCFEQAARLEPAAPQWAYYQFHHYQHHDARKARACLEKAVELCAARQPNNLGPRFRLAELLVEEGDLEAASSQVAILAARQRGSPRVRYLRGLLAVRRGDWREARALLTPLADAPEVRRHVLGELARTAARLGARGLADSYEQQRARAPLDTEWPDPFDDDLHALRVSKQAQMDQGGNAQTPHLAKRALEQLLPLVEAEGQDDFMMQVQISTLLQRAGRWAEAEKAARRALALAPDRVRPYVALGQLLLRKGERHRHAGEAEAARSCFQEAAKLAREAIRLSDQEAFAYVLLGRSLRYLGRPDEALAPFRRAIELRPELSGGHLGLGEALADLGRRREALASLELAVRCAAPDENLPALVLAGYRAKWKAEKKGK